MNNYEKQADDFLKKHDVTIEITFLKNDFHFQDDKEKRDIYEITIKRGNRKMVLNFGQSIMNSQYYQDSIQSRTYTLNGGCRTGNYKITDIEKYKPGLVLKKGVEPSAYAVLSCLPKYDVGTFEDFCREFGYDEDVCILFNDEEFAELQEIK